MTSGGDVDIVVNGIGRRRATPIDASRDDALDAFTELFDANTRTALVLQRTVVASMIERGRGDIVNLTIADVLPSGPHKLDDAATDVYAASMWARTGFTQAWALALRRHNIRVNAIAIGPDGPDGDAARVLVALLAEGPTGRTGETLGAWSGEPQPPRRQRGEDIV